MHDNTNGHFQDNIGPYFIAHALALYQAGLIAVMFGSGNAYQTSYDDTTGDGVSNGNGLATTDVLGQCVACNTHTAVWPDDDGGYLRIFVGAYYAGRRPSQASPAPAPARSPVPQVSPTAPPSSRP